MGKLLASLYFVIVVVLGGGSQFVGTYIIAYLHLAMQYK